MSKIHYQSFTNEESLNESFSKRIRQILAQGIERRGEAWLVVSGGKTPINFFKILSAEPLNWSKINILLADERWVSLEHEASNAKLIKDYLLQKQAKAAHFIDFYQENVSIEQAVKTLEATLSKIPFFDAVILGMGEDGHTASLFPEAENLSEGLTDDGALVLSVKPKYAPFERISLTKKRLCQSQHIFLHLLGHKKMAVLAKALAGEDIEEMPIRAFLQSPHGLEVIYAVE